MFDIQNGIVYLTKGDTAAINVSIMTSQGQQYRMGTGDTLTLTVRKSTTEPGSPLIQVVSQTTSIPIAPSDTSSVAVGQYAADIQLKTAAGNVYTVWPAIESVYIKDGRWKNFKLMPEVTRSV